MSENSLELKSLASTLRKRKPEDNFEELKCLVLNVIKGDRASRIIEMMNDLAEDSLYQSQVILGFINAPAAKRNHHAYRGGLVIHLLEMWQTWKQRFSQDFEQTSEVNDKKILEGIIYHDLHKAAFTFIDQSEPLKMDWSVEYLRGHPDSESLTWETKTLWLLQHHDIELDVQQYSALLWSEGGWSKIQPRWCSVLAKVLYLLDEYSGNVLSRMQDGTWRDVSEEKR